MGEREAAARSAAFLEGRLGPELVCGALEKTFRRQVEISEEATRVRVELANESLEADQRRKLRLDEENLRRRADDERDVEAALRGALLGFRSDDALEYLASTVLRSSSGPETRSAAAEALGQAAKSSPEILKGLRSATRDSKPMVREAALAALARLLARGADTAAELGRSLEDARWTVRLAAARRLADLALPESVDLLLARLPKEQGRVRREFADLLAALTGQGFGLEPEGWNHWWKENRAAFASGEKALTIPAEAASPEAAQGDRGAHFYGIEIESQRIMFVIDISGSMEEPGSAPGLTKEQEAKKELVRCVKSLGKEDAFGVFAYSDSVQKWTPAGGIKEEKGERPVAGRTMIFEASDETKTRALQWIEKLDAAAWTNTYAALEEALRVSVADPRNDMGKEYGLFPDTIFLLTDGAPTGPTGKTKGDAGEPEWQRVLQGVRGWNRGKRVVINAIGIGPTINSEFLTTLAQENGGKFVHVK